ncbi:MAG: hypothetical protein ACFFCS_20120 [Candidatus Hodarchaeota archaeon]
MFLYMIIILVVSTIFNWIVGSLNKGGFKNFWRVLCCTGIPVHELSHLLACKIFRVPVVEVKLLNREKQGQSETYNGHVTQGSDSPHVVSSFVISFAPTLVAIPLSLFLLQVLFLLTTPPMTDPKIIGIVVVGLFLLGIISQCGPSIEDLSNFLKYSGGHKLQFLCFVVGCIIGYYLSEVLIVLPLEPLYVVVKMIVFFLPAWVLNKVVSHYQK